MRILATGGTGFIGTHLLRALSPLGHELHAIGRVERETVAGVTYHFLDLRDFDKAQELIHKINPDVIYHLAANSIESSGEHSPIDMTTNGYNTFFNTIVPAIQAKNLKKFIYMSSASVYGSIRTPYAETQQPKPQDIYAISKYANELSLQVLAKTYNFSYVIARAHNVTGEGQDPVDPRRNVVPMFMQLLRLGKQPKIHGDGSSVRCYTYVGDVVDALVKSLDVDNVIYNVGSDTATTIQELYNEIVDISGIHTEPEYLPERDNEVVLNTVAHKVARKLFNTKTTPFRETIQRTWDWLCRQPLQSFKSYDKEINI